MNAQTLEPESFIVIVKRNDLSWWENWVISNFIWWIIINFSYRNLNHSSTKKKGISLYRSKEILLREDLFNVWKIQGKDLIKEF